MRSFLSALLLVSLMTVWLPLAPASAQIGDVPGPGQPVPRPASQCPQTIACTYDEHTLIPAGYRFQSLTVCGANCTTQYWVSAVADGKLLVEVTPVRGGGMIAVARAAEADGRPAVRTILPSYGAADPACCPSSYVDTTYAWDPAQGTLVAGEPIAMPADDTDVWSEAHDRLMKEGFVEVFGGA